MRNFLLTLVGSLLIFAGNSFAASTDTVKGSTDVVKYQPVLESTKTVIQNPLIPSDKVVVLYMAYPLEENPWTGEMYKPSGLCSGFFIGENGQIMTAKHCVDGDVESIEVKTHDNKRYKAKTLYISDEADLALLKIDRTGTPHFDIADSIAQGDEIYALGHPLRNEYVLTRGIVAKEVEDEQKKMLVDMTVLPGNSGCPVYNSKGELVGVLSAGFTMGFGSPTGLNLAVTIESINRLLNLFRGL